MNKSNSQVLILPALRAHMGDWIYYITFLRMRDIAARVSIAEEIHSNSTLNELIQRSLTERSTDIKEYLKNQSQRFFNTLVIGVYGGSPSWYEMTIGGNHFLSAEDIPPYIDGAVGILVLEGGEKLFAIDGQHRVAGIQKALEEDIKIHEEEVSAVFVAHKNDTDGLQRTRRLFTTLNRYAKPASKYDAIALDEDDIVAVVTRRLLNDYPLFAGKKISSAKGKNIPIADTQSLTTIVALYDVMNIYLKDTSDGKWATFKKYRPSSDIVESFYRKAEDFWMAMSECFSVLREIRESLPDQQVASNYRHGEGGHLLFRPIGLQMVVTIIRKLVDSGVLLEQAVRLVSRVPMEISAFPWKGLLWDETNKRMLTQATNRVVGEKLIFYAVGGELATLKSTPNKLRQEFAGLLNRQINEVELPTYI
jgi:DNA sulfur modification protein DndB